LLNKLIFRSKIRKLLKEKEVQDQILKENQLIVKEIALKYTTDSETWNRQKQKLLEKEKLVKIKLAFDLNFARVAFFILLSIPFLIYFCS
jgi:hypothetical protein